MIKHIVIFKLTQPYTSGEKKSSLKRLNEIFSPLGKMLDFIIEYKTAINILEAEYAGDFVINSTFRSLEDLNRYIASEEHRKAVAEASVIRKTKIVADYID
ncbi:MAG: Dabb family protein [Bacteroidales bacterium]|nr:Dabb family protein [Bacteroidales bacterium]